MEQPSGHGSALDARIQRASRSVVGWPRLASITCISRTRGLPLIGKVGRWSRPTTGVRLWAWPRRCADRASSIS